MEKTANKISLIVVCGPTGIGKTAAAIGLAEALGGEIISADSMQIYRHMDVGTAKPTPDEQARVRHHLIDVVDPDEPFDAALFSTLAREVASVLAGQGKLAVVAGGTGLYIRAMLHGLFDHSPSDPDLRQRLNQEAEDQGAPALHQRLAGVDPEAAAKVHPNDRLRIVRALEIHALTGVPLSRQQRAHGFAHSPFAAFKIGLTMDRESLYRRIDRRVDAMVDQGLTDEVRRLMDMGYGPDLKSMQAIGYRHMADFIAQRLPWEEAIRTLKRDTRRFAKRQFTWFNAEPEIDWFEPDRIGDMTRAATAFLERSSQ
ncbi:MAG: tRNA (adenosine(37)-N6)-dimethylallyltransferase MiaA [Desulfobacterales bacterium]|nr:tRNA (adenosine(37)-N6)-dimethylallyltransferase MiaA [Desulfobacterales bacterium]